MQLSNLIFRKVTFFASIVVLGMFALTGCGGSDGDGDVVDVPATVPEVLNYEIRQATGINLLLNQGGSEVTVSSTLLTGSFDRITEDFTLSASPVPLMSVSASDFLSTLMTGEYNDYSLAVNTTLQWTGDGNPTSGEFDLRVGPVNRIRVKVNPDVNNSGIAGVDISYSPTGDADPPVLTDSLTWDEFEEAFGSTAQEYQQVAAFGYSVLRFMYEQGELVILALELISENDIQLEQTGTVEQNCDSFSPLTTSPPVSYDPGFIKVNWTDVNNDTGIGAGDIVYLGFTQCWDNDESDIFDTLYDGTVNLVNYTEVENAGVVTRIGFEPSASSDGGIDYEYLKITETETTMSNVIINESEQITLTGGFSMIFTSP